MQSRALRATVHSHSAEEMHASQNGIPPTASAHFGSTRYTRLHKPTSRDSRTGVSRAAIARCDQRATRSQACTFGTAATWGIERTPKLGGTR